VASAAAYDDIARIDIERNSIRVLCSFAKKNDFN
jgi:hypothetical protein